MIREAIEIVTFTGMGASMRWNKKDCNDEVL